MLFGYGGDVRIKSTVSSPTPTPAGFRPSPVRTLADAGVGHESLRASTSCAISSQRSASTFLRIVRGFSVIRRARPSAVLKRADATDSDQSRAMQASPEPRAPRTDYIQCLPIRVEDLVGSAAAPTEAQCLLRRRDPKVEPNPVRAH